MRKRKVTALIILVTFLLSIFATGAMAKNNAESVNVQINQDGSVQVAMKFRDMNEAKWAVKNVLKMNAENIIMGYNDGSFRPNKPVTHAEAVVLTMRAAGLQSEIDNKVASSVTLPFKDAKSIPTWAKSAVAVAVEKGYLEAGQSVNFQANKAANREWVVKLIAKALNLQPVDIELPFTDADKISADTLDYVAAVVYKQLISGYPDGSFKPTKPVTRAEIAVMLGISTGEEAIPGAFKFKVEGTINSVSTTPSSVTDGMYGTVTDEIYGSTQVPTQGTVTLDVNKDDDDDDESDETKVTVTYPVAADALIYINDQAAKLGDLTVGSKAEAVVKNGVIVFLEVEPEVVKGVVQAVYDTSITVVNSNWGHGKKNDSQAAEATTYNLAANVAVTLNGAAATVADLKAGDVVKLTLNAEEKVSSIKAARFAVRIQKKNGMPDPHAKLKEKAQEQMKERDRDMEQNREQDRDRENKMKQGRED